MKSFWKVKGFEEQVSWNARVPDCVFLEKSTKIVTFTCTCTPTFTDTFSDTSSDNAHAHVRVRVRVFVCCVVPCHVVCRAWLLVFFVLRQKSLVVDCLSLCCAVCCCVLLLLRLWAFVGCWSCLCMPYPSPDGFFFLSLLLPPSLSLTPTCVVSKRPRV